RIIDLQTIRDSNLAAHGGEVLRRHLPIEVSRAVDHQSLTVLLKHILFEHRDGSSFAAAVVSGSGVAAKNANLRVASQFRIDLANGCQKISIKGMVPDVVGRLGCRLPDLLQLGFGYVLASNVAIKVRLLRSAGEFHDNIPHLLREVRMTNQSDS